MTALSSPRRSYSNKEWNNGSDNVLSGGRWNYTQETKFFKNKTKSLKKSTGTIEKTY